MEKKKASMVRTGRASGLRYTKNIWRSFLTKRKLIIVTFNYRHFREMDLGKNTGVIGLSNNLTVEQIDIKLNALLSKSKKGDLYSKTTYIRG